MLLRSKIIAEGLALSSDWAKGTVPNSIGHAYSRVRESKCVCTRMHVCALRVHDLCAFMSRDFALTQCQRPVFMAHNESAFWV